MSNSIPLEVGNNNLIEDLHNILNTIDHNLDDNTLNIFISYYLWKEFGIGERPAGDYIEGFNELAHYVEMLYAERIQRYTQINGQ